MELDNILQLTFGILALLTTIAVSYITYKLAAGMSSQPAPCGMTLTHTSRPSSTASSFADDSRPMFYHNNPHGRTVSDSWYRRRAIFMEDTIWSGGLGDDVHVP
jgi:hypothetical protein